MLFPYLKDKYKFENKYKFVRLSLMFRFDSEHRLIICLHLVPKAKS